MKAYSYVRFSTTKQKDGDSERRQVALSKDYAGKHGLILDETLNLRDLGVSAFKGANVATGKLGQFLVAIKSGVVPKGSYLLIESLDRLSRAEIDDAYGVFRSILKEGVNIVTLQDGQVFTRESLNDFSKIIVSLVVMSRAHEESLTKSKRGKANWVNKRNQIRSGKVMPGNIPVWLKRTNDGFVVDAEMATAIKFIFAQYLDGVGVLKIARQLTDKKYKVVSKRVKVWRCDIVQRLLRNRTVTGALQPHVKEGNTRKEDGDVVVGYYPTIIDEKTYNAVQGRLSTVAPKRGRYSEGLTNLFTGKLFCPYCGGRVDVFTAYPSRGEKHYAPIKRFQCTNGVNGHCSVVSWRVEEFEKDFMALATEVKRFMFAQQETKPLEQEVHAIEQKLKEEAKKLERFTNLVAESDLLPKTILAKITETETTIESLQVELRTSEAKLQSLVQSNRNVDVSLVEKLNLTTDERERLYNIIQSTVKRVRLFFAGPRMMHTKYAKRFAELKQTHTPAAAAKVVRKEFDTKKNRFFVVDLNRPGEDNRVAYPLHDSLKYGLFLNEAAAIDKASA